MTWVEFEEGIAARVRNAARSLYRRWPLPAAVLPEDIEQELWAGCWRGWNEYRADAGSMQQGAYAYFVGTRAAMGWLREQRNPKRGNSREEGRFPALLPEGFDTVVTQGQEAAVSFRQALESALRECASYEVVEALGECLEEGGSWSGAGYSKDVRKAARQRAQQIKEAVI